MPKMPVGPHPKLPRELTPLPRTYNKWNAVLRRMERMRLGKRTHHPRIWKSSPITDIRRLWNSYYLNSSYRLYKQCMGCETFDDMLPRYKIAKEFIDRVATERPTKIGYRADEYRDNMKKKLEYLRWKEIRSLCEKPPPFEPITERIKM